jgi:hypothetical protein
MIRKFGMEVTRDEVKRILLECGVYPKKNGFAYLTEAVAINIEKPCGVCELYEKVADAFGVKAANVERCIRVCLAEILNSGAIVRLNELFGMKIISDNTYLSNGDFIGIITVCLGMTERPRWREGAI